MTRVGFTILVAATIGAGLLVTNTAGAAVSQAQLKARLISVSDLPTGWSVNNGAHITNAGCLLPTFATLT